MKLKNYFYILIFGTFALSSCDNAIVDDSLNVLELVDDEFLVKKGSSIKLNILDNDNIIAFEEVSLNISTPLHGSIISQSEEISFLYTPDKNFLGVENLTYTVCIGDEECAKASITILVENSKINPQLPDSCNYSIIAFNDVISSNKDTIIIYKSQLLENDYSCGSELKDDTFIYLSEPSYGKLFYKGDYAVLFVPNVNFIEDEFSYKICNGNGSCDKATVKLLNSDYISPTLD